MITLYLIIGGVLLVGGAVAGIMAVIAWGIHREESSYSMTIHPPSRAAAGARRANGMYARFPGVIQEARYYRQDYPRSRRERKGMAPWQ